MHLNIYLNNIADGVYYSHITINNKVKVSTTGYADPAGAIPLSFVNMFVQQQPYQMLMKMKKEVNNPLYAQPKLPDVLK